MEEDSAPELATEEVMNNSYTGETNKELLDTTLDDDGAEDDVEAEAVDSRGNGQPESSSDARKSPQRYANTVGREQRQYGLLCLIENLSQLS